MRSLSCGSWRPSFDGQGGLIVRCRCLECDSPRPRRLGSLAVAAQRLPGAPASAIAAGLAETARGLEPGTRG
jgi:hypothetical protein